MIQNSLSKVLEKILKIADKLKIKIVIMGGIATSFFTKPRATYDIDGLISLDEKKLDNFLNAFKRFGFKSYKIKSIEGLPFITLYQPKSKIYIDLFLAKNDFQREIIRRAKRVKFNKLNLFIISCEDLILTKLKVQREKDLEDVRCMILENKEDLDFDYLYKWAKILKVEVFLKDELKSLDLEKRIK